MGRLPLKRANRNPFPRADFGGETQVPREPPWDHCSQRAVSANALRPEADLCISNPECLSALRRHLGLEEGVAGQERGFVF